MAGHGRDAQVGTFPTPVSRKMYRLVTPETRQRLQLRRLRIFKAPLQPPSLCRNGLAVIQLPPPRKRDGMHLWQGSRSTKRDTLQRQRDPLHNFGMICWMSGLREMVQIKRLRSGRPRVLMRQLFKEHFKPESSVPITMMSSMISSLFTERVNQEHANEYYLFCLVTLCNSGSSWCAEKSGPDGK
jgi:hypothetical protein